MEIRKLLACDMGSVNCGFAVFINGKYEYSEQFHIDSKDPSEKVSIYYNKVEEIVKKYKIDDVVYEKAHMHYTAIAKLSEFIGILRLVCFNNKIEDPSSFATTSIKKGFCGYGKASKDDVYDKAVELTGNEDIGYDEADAIALGQFYTDLPE